MNKKNMKYITIFALSYIFINIILTVLFTLIWIMFTDKESGILLNIFFLLFGSAISSYFFVNDHGRVFNNNEYKEILIGSILINILWFLLKQIKQFYFIFTHSHHFDEILFHLSTSVISTIIVIGVNALLLALFYSRKFTRIWIRK